MTRARPVPPAPQRVPTTRTARDAVAADAPTTPTTLQACAALGVRARRETIRERPAPARTADVAEQILATLRGGQIALVTGPSGSGKTTLLATIRDRLDRAGARHAPVAPEPSAAAPGPDDARETAPRSVVDSLEGPVERRLALLSSAGLADAALLPRDSLKLSAGETWRLGLARALAAAGPGGWVLGDEFAALLDRPTARSVAASLARWIRRTRAARAIVVTAHDDLGEPIRPDIHVRFDADGSIALDR